MGKQKTEQEIEIASGKYKTDYERQKIGNIKLNMRQNMGNRKRNMKGRKCKIENGI